MYACLRFLSRFLGATIKYITFLFLTAQKIYAHTLFLPSIIIFLFLTILTFFSSLAHFLYFLLRVNVRVCVLLFVLWLYFWTRFPSVMLFGFCGNHFHFFFRRGEIFNFEIYNLQNYSKGESSDLENNYRCALSALKPQFK